jgi:hypothetical protein
MLLARGSIRADETTQIFPLLFRGSGSVLDFPRQTIDGVGVRTFVHRLAHERQRVGELIDRPQITFHFANRIENWIVRPDFRRAEIDNFCHLPQPLSPKQPILSANGFQIEYAETAVVRGKCGKFAPLGR